ncbi:acyltransferase family protein [Mixta intestinalis]|nr:acyltransferase [Mixta intestinalis]
MRGFACLIVVLLHYGAYINNLFSFGKFGVDLFFIISGFIITLTTSKNKSIIHFLRKRFLRIYPIYFIVWLFFCLTLYYNESLSTILKSLFLLHKDYSQPAPGYGWNMLGPPWTLAYEVVFYFIFALAMKINHRRRIHVATATIILAVVGLQYLYNGNFHFNSSISAHLDVKNPGQAVIKLLSTTILFEFIAGMIIAYNYDKIKTLKPKTYIPLGVLLLIVSFFVFIKYHNTGFGMDGFFWFTLPLFLGLLLLEPLLIKFQFRALSFMGDISYTLYLIHFPILLLYEKHFPTFGMHHYSFLKFLILIGSSILISTLLHKYIEKPLMLKK